MNNKTLTITALALAVMVIMAAVAVGCTKKATEEPITETEKIEIVQETAPEMKGEATSKEPEMKKNDNHNTDINTDIPGSGQDPAEELPEEPETTLSAEELAQIVIDAGINGDARKAELGDRYDEVQAWIDENYVPPVRYVEQSAEPVYYGGGGVLTPSAGVNYYAGRMETYYNLDMSGVLDIMYSLGYSGEYWIRGDGVKMFGPYVMVACDFGEYPRGSVIETSLGTALVCDTGSGGWGWTDIAVTW